MLAAMAKTTLLPVAPERSWRRLLTPLLIPLTAATALVIWLAIPREAALRYESPAPASSAAQDRELPATMADSARRDEQQERDEFRRSVKVDDLKKKEADAANRLAQTAPATAAPAFDRPAEAPPAPPAPPPAAPPQVAGARASAAPAPPPQRAEERAAGARASADEIQLRARVMSEAAAKSSGFEVRSADPMRRWRVVAGRLERSTDGGSTWVAQNLGSPVDLIAGASPAPDVCWLVGRAGTVLLTTDGRSWQRLRFPEAVDLVAIRATDAATATVVTADGRSFTTEDAGLTWNPGPLQEFPAAPF
jgi:hypothetical protein